MKYEFRKGQWFDARKLTDWQKQWCLDNLNILSSSELDFEKGRFHFWLYDKWTNLGNYFGSASKHYIELEDEITFNDFYWGENEEETTSSVESVFDNPKWVTVKGEDGDTTAFFGYQLVCGKDYKVVNKSNGGYDIQLTPTKVVEVAEEYFHKVTPQDLLPDECKDNEDSFDNLVYVKPDLHTYDNWVIKLNNLSEDQLIFISEYFKTDCRYSPTSNTQDVIMSCLSGKDSRFVWTNNTKNFMPSTSCHYVSFNDIFKEVK